MSEIAQNDLIHTIKENKFKIADLELKMSFIERVDKEEPISKPKIRMESFLLLRKEFPGEDFTEIVKKYGKQEVDYLEHLSQRIAQYQAWKKEGSIEDLKENARKEMLRLTNPKEYDLLLKKEEKKQEYTKGKGFSR